MDMHRLKCVVSLAHLGNVTQAAKENCIAQPTMTTTITSVEKELGVRLFNRSQRAVTLTPAGRSFSCAAEKIIKLYNEAVVEAKRLDANQTIDGRLTIGFNDLSTGSHTKLILSEIRLKHPDLNIRLYKSSISDLVNCLFDGRADIIFSNQFEVQGHSSIHFIPVKETWPAVFLHRSHPLVERQYLKLNDLKGETLLCAGTDTDPKKLSPAAHVLQNAGIPYSEESPIAGEEAIISMVEAGLGIYPAAAWYRYAFSEDVVCLPIDIDVEHMFIVVAWKNHHLASFAKDFANIVMTTFQSAEQSDEYKLCL